MTLLSQSAVEYYERQFKQRADEDVKALEALQSATSIQFVRETPTAEEMQDAWVDWWKQWFAAIERGRKPRWSIMKRMEGGLSDDYSLYASTSIPCRKCVAKGKSVSDPDCLWCTGQLGLCQSVIIDSSCGVNSHTAPYTGDAGDETDAG